MRRLNARLAWLCVLAAFAAGCQRNLVYIDTPAPNGGNVTPERQAVLESISGGLETRGSANADWAAAVNGQPLSEGSQVRTAAGGSGVLRLTEGSRLYVGPESEFTLKALNPYLDSLLTTVELTEGSMWVLLNGGAVDIETPFGTATARNAYLSVEYEPQGRDLTVMCLQGVCGFGSVLIPSGYKLVEARTNTAPEPMGLGDYGAWAQAVPEATQLAFLATEAVAQGSATLPVVATSTATATEPPTATDTEAPSATPSDTPPPDVPTDTPQPPTNTPSPEPPTRTPVPSPTMVPPLPTVTPLPFTPIPPAPILGRHTVLPGETLFCIARGYGVLPSAIAQASGLASPFLVRSGQVLSIPQVQWRTISDGPVCPPQFTSPFPGLPLPTATREATPAPVLAIKLEWNCTGNCGSSDGEYAVRITASATGGVPPYSFNPGQSFDVFVPHCTNGSGTVTVTSADGQTASASWFYDDVACPNN